MAAVYSFGLVEYKLEESLDILLYSKAAYCNRDCIKNWTCGKISEFHPQMTHIRPFYNTSHDTQGYVGYHNNHIVIAFKGSGFSLKNWKNNLKFKQMSQSQWCEGCKIHTGFFEAYLSLKQQLFESLESLINLFPFAQIIITGHSLGGALATFASIEIEKFLIKHDSFNLIKEIHTFGSPRVGNSVFSDYYNNLLPQTIRVVQSKDLVTKLPPTFLGYSHVGTEVLHHTENKSFGICKLLQRGDSCSSSIRLPNIINYITDHLFYLNNFTGCRFPNTKINCVDSSKNESCNQ